jgi:formylglycine-generating enzyme required for sulfatase activity
MCLSPALTRRAVLALLLSAAPACTNELPARGQLVLYVSTDAPLPPRAGFTPSRDDPQPLFDRLRVDLYEPLAAAPCAGCSRDLEVDRASVDDGQVSFGVVPEALVSGLRVRLRLFRAAAQLDDEPHPDATIEHWVALPPVEQEGIVEVTAFLATDKTGTVEGGSAAPIAASEGRPQPVETWPHAARTHCPSAPRPGEVCVPGGAYWMGNPRAAWALDTSIAQRLVVLSPFYLDAAEVSVAAYREVIGGALGDPIIFDGTFPPRKPADLCTYTPEPGPYDGHPVSCISQQQARRYCQTRPGGGDLPTEAQLEYVLGGLRSQLYLWGEDEPGCGDAAYGQPDGDLSGECAPTHDFHPFPINRPGYGRDVLELPTGVVVDLAGNVSEHARDVYQHLAGPCWAAPIHFDPWCPAPDGPQQTVARGGAWTFPGPTMRAAFRNPVAPPPLLFSGNGFRCMRPAA